MNPLGAFALHWISIQNSQITDFGGHDDAYVGCLYVEITSVRVHGCYDVYEKEALGIPSPVPIRSDCSKLHWELSRCFTQVLLDVLHRGLVEESRIVLENSINESMSMIGSSMMVQFSNECPSSERQMSVRLTNAVHLDGEGGSFASCAVHLKKKFV